MAIGLALPALLGGERALGVSVFVSGAVLVCSRNVRPVTKRPQEPRVAVRNASDAKQVQRAKESERARFERERNEDVAVWGTREGRAFTRRLLADAGVYRLSMANDPHWTAFNEGARNVGLALLARMTTTAPDEYLLMEQEFAADEQHEPDAPDSPDTENTDARSDD